MQTQRHADANGGAGTLDPTLKPSAAPDAGPVPAPAVLQVFIVEDSPLILDSLVAMLEEMAPVKVVGHAQSEAAAVEKLRQLDGGLDLVIVDIFLQSGSGLGVLRGMAQHGLRAKRIVLSNYATAEMGKRCASLGAERQFDKSTDIEKLVAYCHALAAESNTSAEPPLH